MFERGRKPEKTQTGTEYAKFHAVTLALKHHLSPLNHHVAIKLLLFPKYYEIIMRFLKNLYAKS